MFVVIYFLLWLCLHPAPATTCFCIFVCRRQILQNLVGWRHFRPTKFLSHRHIHSSFGGRQNSDFRRVLQQPPSELHLRCAAVWHTHFILALFSVFSCFSSLYCILDIQVQIEVDLSCHFLFSRRKIAEQIFREFFCYSSFGQQGCLPSLGHRRFIGKGHTNSSVNTPRPNTLEVSLRAQGTAGPAGAIQLASNQRNVAFYNPMRAWPGHCGLLMKGPINIRPTTCRSVIFLEYHEIYLISSTMVFQGVDFVKYLSFPSSEGRPRGPTSSSLSPNSFFRKIICSICGDRQGCLGYPEA